MCVVADFTAVVKNQKKSRSYSLELQWEPAEEPARSQPELPSIGSRLKDGVMLSEKNELLLLKPSLPLPSAWTMAARFRLPVRNSSQQDYATIFYGYDEDAEHVTEDSTHIVVVRERKRARVGPSPNPDPNPDPNPNTNP